MILYFGLVKNYNKFTIISIYMNHFSNMSLHIYIAVISLNVDLLNINDEVFSFVNKSDHECTCSVYTTAEVLISNNFYKNYCTFSYSL